MFKVAVLSLLVLGCSALPYQQSGFRYGGQQSFLTSQPKIVVGLNGLNSGYSRYGSGISSGLYGSGISSGLYGSGISSGLYGSGIGSGISTGLLGGLNSGYSTYGSGLQLGNSYGLRAGYGGGYGYGSGALLASAPVSTQVIAAPVATIAAPIATTQYVSAAPAVHSTLGLNQNINLLNVRQGQQFEQVVPAAIQQISRTVEYVPFANQEQPIQAQVVEIEPSDNPVHLHFKTRSSTLSTSQSHIAAQAPEVQTAAAQDEPQRLITEVQKPVIQEVKEVISPFRQVTQQINPVVESLHTTVAKGEGLRQQFVGQQYHGLGQQYAAQQYAAPSIQTVVAAPAVQNFAVQAAPAIQTVALQSAPVAVETVAVQAAPAIAFQQPSASFQTFSAAPAIQTFSAAPAIQTSYSTAPAFQTSYSTAPASNSFFKLGSSSQKFGVLSKPISSGSYSSYSSSSSGY